MRQWCNSEWIVMPSIIFQLLRCHWTCFGGVLSVTRPLTKTVIKQWWDSHATLIEQWCLWFELFYVIFKHLRWHWSYFFQLLRCHWTYFIILQCLGGVLSVTRPFDKNSDQTVMRQSCNIDRTVLPLIWALLCHFQAFEMALIIFFLSAMPWECFWWHKTIWQKQWSNSDETVMHQWRDSDGTVMPLIWEILCHILSFCNALGVCLVTQDLLTKNSDQTVMQQW
jgi:hypothetical protein